MTEIEKILLKTAKQAIIEKFTGEHIINKETLYNQFPELKEKRATFVTLYMAPDQDLRGCIGTLEPVRPLLEDVIHNARAAAFNDYRFDPLSPNELPDMLIEISLLSIPQKVEYNNIEELKNKIIPFQDGIVLQKDRARATFLPQVWGQLSDFDLFFQHLCRKAGLPPDCLYEHPDIYKYTVKEIKDF